MSGSPTENENNQVDESVAEGSTAESPAANGVETAESPAAEGSKESLVDRIQKAVNKGEPEETPVLEGEKGKESDPKATPEGQVVEEDKPFTKEDLPNLNSKTRKRVGKLLEMVDSVSQERDGEKQVADQYRGIIGFLKENDVTMDDANAAFQILADMNRNPEAALAALLPFVEQLQRATAQILPDDLQKEVTAGYITEDRAREIAKLRIKDERTTSVQTRSAETAASEEKRISTQNALNIQSGISEWESKWASTDPDYQKLRVDVQDEIELSLSRAQKAGTLPKTVEEAVKFAEDAKKRVISKVTRFQPLKKEIRHVTGSSGGPAHSAPKTLAEAIQQGVNR